MSQYHECKICTSLKEPELTVIIECYGLERTLKIIQFNLLSEAGDLPLDRGTQSSIQTDFEHLQGSGVHNLSGGIIFSECIRQPSIS